MNDSEHVYSLQDAESFFLSQFKESKGTKEDFTFAALSSMIDDLERQKITPKEIITKIRSRFEFQGWRQFFFYRNSVVETFLDEVKLSTEMPYPNIPVGRALLPPLTKLVEAIERDYGTLVSLCDSSISGPNPILLSSPPSVATVDSFVKVPVEMRTALSAGVPIMVIDSGIDNEHPDLAHILDEQCMDFSGDYDSSDYNGHGTHCSGIIAGRGIVDGDMIGMAPGAKLFHGKVLDKGGIIRTESILSALEWALEKEISIINLSLGSDTSKESGPSLLARVCEEVAVTYPVLLVCSAGNSGFNERTWEPLLGTITDPAISRHVIAVGAVDAGYKLAPFSSKGSPDPNSDQFEKPDLCGLGVAVVSCKSRFFPSSPGYQNPYVVMSGTSMAAPYISGLAAVVYGALKAIPQQKERVEKLKQLLFEGAEKPLNDRGAPYAVYEVGRGVPDLPAILKSLGYKISARPQEEPETSKQGKKCNWTGIPFGSSWKVNIEFFACTDAPDTYVSARAFQKYKEEAGGRCVSKELLVKELLVKYKKYQDAIQKLGTIQQKQIVQFKYNIEKKARDADFSEIRGSMAFGSPFFMDGKSLDPLDYTCLYYCVVKEGRKSQLFGLVWQPFDMKALPQVDEYYIGGELSFDDLSLGVSMQSLQYIELLHDSFNGTAFWVPKTLNSPSGDLFILENPKNREERCLHEIETAFRTHAVGRVSLPTDIANTIIERWSESYVLALKSKVFRTVKEADSILFITKS